MSLLDQLNNEQLMAQFVQLSQTELGEGAMPKPKQESAPPEPQEPQEEMHWSQESLDEMKEVLVATWGDEQTEADIAHFAKIPAKKINDLPDSDFAFIEKGGKKVDGKTEPRSLRHLPLVDAAHVRNALARINQVKKKDGKKLTPAEVAQAMKKIRAAAKKFGVKVSGPTKASRERKEQLMSLTKLREQYASDEVCTHLINQFTAVFGEDGELPEDQLQNLEQMLTLKATEAEAFQKKLEEKDKELQAQKEAGDTLKADLETVKTEAETQKQTLEGLVASAKSSERTAKADRLEADLVKQKHWPNCIKIVSHYARQEEALNEIFNGTKVEGEGDDAKPVKASLVTALLELMANIPENARAGAFTKEETSHEPPVAQTDLDALHADMKARGRKAALMAQGLSEEEMNKALQKDGLKSAGLPK